MKKEVAKGYIGKTLNGYLIDDVTKTKLGWTAYFDTPEGYRFAPLLELVKNSFPLDLQ
jgi:hypothetical protein